MKILIPDSGPLTSLAKANALDLIFVLKADVCITDIVYHEVTFVRASGNKIKMENADKIHKFITKHQEKISIVKTLYGDNLLKKHRSGELPNLPRDAGEISILSFDKTSNTRNIILFEDNWFLKNGKLSSRSCLISLTAFLRATLKQNLISYESYAQIMKSLDENSRNLVEVDLPQESE